MLSIKPGGISAPGFFVSFETMNKKIRILKTLLLVAVLSFNSLYSAAQDPERFAAELISIDTVSRNIDPQKKVVVFTGSSSIRKWEGIDSIFSEVNAINTGFGGSHMSDLLYYADRLIIRYQPDVVFIYEGDNDIAEGKSPDEVLKDAVRLVRRLTGQLPDTEIIFISVKPAPARWKFKDQYTELNRKLESFCAKHKNITYVDVWDAMLDNQNLPDSTLYIDDYLHLNEKGYALWTALFRFYID